MVSPGSFTNLWSRGVGCFRSGICQPYCPLHMFALGSCRRYLAHHGAKNPRAHPPAMAFPAALARGGWSSGQALGMLDAYFKTRHGKAGLRTFPYQGEADQRRPRMIAELLTTHENRLQSSILLDTMRTVMPALCHVRRAPTDLPWTAHHPMIAAPSSPSCSIIRSTFQFGNASYAIAV